MDDDWESADEEFDADTKFILLHETKNEEGIRGFLHEVWELYLKVSSSLS